MATYHIKLPIFEGPLDLLLYFIERDEIDIYDIPIGKITADFLDYLRYLEEEKVEIGSDFIAMAAELMSIKARMLLPRYTRQKDSEEDPRQNLVDRLIAYKQMKKAAEYLQTLWDKRRFYLPRGYAIYEQQRIQKHSHYDNSFYKLTLANLLKVYIQLLKKKRMRDAPLTITIKPFPYTVQNVKEIIRENIKIKPRWHFVDLILIEAKITFLVVCFLAILDMVQNGELKVVIGERPNEFWIESTSEGDHRLNGK